jgi:hypothetical protein
VKCRSDLAAEHGLSQLQARVHQLHLPQLRGQRRAQGCGGEAGRNTRQRGTRLLRQPQHTGLRQRRHAPSGRCHDGRVGLLHHNKGSGRVWLPPVAVASQALVHGVLEEGRDEGRGHVSVREERFLPARAPGS